MPLDRGGLVPLRVSSRTEIFPSMPPLREFGVVQNQQQSDERKNGRDRELIDTRQGVGGRGGMPPEDSKDEAIFIAVGASPQRAGHRLV